MSIQKGLLRWMYTLALLLATQCVWAQEHAEGEVASNEDEIVVSANALTKDAIFENTAKYVFEVKNGTATPQQGKISYAIIGQDGEKYPGDSVQVNIAAKSVAKFNFDIKGHGPGFYRVNFMINVSEYDDTLHKVFGIQPEKLVSNHKKPADFDEFWRKAKAELADVEPAFQCTLMPGLSTPICNVYLVQMQSLGNVTIRGWLTEPVTKNPNKKFAIVVGLPGYQVPLSPIMTVGDPDLAFLTLNVRGQGNSRDAISTRHDEFVVHHIDDKNKYVMRGVVMDCLRAIDFVFTRPELKHDNIFVKGGSMGGFLAIATASLDKRVNLCSAQSPIFADIRSLVKRVTFPITSINLYLKTQPGLTLDKVLDNFDYFDVKNFAPNIKCRFIMSIGLLDTFVAPTNDYTVFNAMTTNKKIMVFKDYGHDVSPLYIQLETAWMHDQFGLFY
ncbi:acetylxylan esterase [Mucilaginibacter antarcticus]|uniref:Acetylxylan esterase n=1 Tax=Mucilaginibacter antarcticus TaxID=1855725 RepID=A0ABW5XTX6_9SPHI